MKKIFFTLIALVGFATLGLSQDMGTVAISEGKADLTASKSSGKYIFTLPSTVTEEMVKKNASYYPSYFTVGFNKSSKEATINLVNNEVQSRYVIARFLTACGVREVKVDDETLKIDQLIDQYLK